MLKRCDNCGHEYYKGAFDTASCPICGCSETSELIECEPEGVYKY